MQNIRSYISPSGFTVLVGKNCDGNEHISHHLANPEDTWFHAKDIPGPHVLLRQGDHAREDIIYAAQLSVKIFGKVSMTLAKNIKKQKGPKGLVTLSSEKILFKVHPALHK